MTRPVVDLQKESAVEQFQATFNRLNIDTLNLLGDIYTDDVVFTDPFHHVEGLDELTVYFRSMYENLTRCEFEYKTTITEGDDTCIVWIMIYQHKKIRGGSPVSVNGCTWLRFRDEHVCAHRDYFDAGEMLYQQLPVLGQTIRWVRSRVA